MERLAERALSLTEGHKGHRGRQTLGKTREHSTVEAFSHHPCEMSLGLAYWLAGRLKESGEPEHFPRVIPWLTVIPFLPQLCCGIEFPMFGSLYLIFPFSLLIYFLG